jgi:hypothetical protein
MDLNSIQPGRAHWQAVQRALAQPSKPNDQEKSLEQGRRVDSLHLPSLIWKFMG